MSEDLKRYLCVELRDHINMIKSIYDNQGEDYTDQIEYHAEKAVAIVDKLEGAIIKAVV